ncbi:hypothetical protein [Bifidobacterium biavatii]|uniref:hypothetical protein n=1 Tax=Bifidobacterium biavatii TaxID=762212 RepID=UPI000A6EE90E|nr:hypothetical protein [Bifidobacterium biavatii]
MENNTITPSHDQSDSARVVTQWKRLQPCHHVTGKPAKTGSRDGKQHDYAIA